MGNLFLVREDGRRSHKTTRTALGSFMKVILRWFSFLEGLRKKEQSATVRERGRNGGAKSIPGRKRWGLGEQTEDSIAARQTIAGMGKRVAAGVVCFLGLLRKGETPTAGVSYARGGAACGENAEPVPKEQRPRSFAGGNVRKLSSHSTQTRARRAGPIACTRKKKCARTATLKARGLSDRNSEKPSRVRGAERRGKIRVVGGLGKRTRARRKTRHVCRTQEKRDAYEEASLHSDRIRKL